MLCLVACKTNADGTNPCDRHRAFIDKVHADGAFEFGFRHEHYKAVRDYLTDSGWIDWQDNRYLRGFRGGKGGEASKWSLNHGLVQEITSVLSLQSDIVPPSLSSLSILVTNPNKGGNGERVRPVQRRVFRNPVDHDPTAGKELVGHQGDDDVNDGQELHPTWGHEDKFVDMIWRMRLTRSQKRKLIEAFWWYRMQTAQVAAPRDEPEPRHRPVLFSVN